MGLDLTYDLDGATFTHRFSHADWDTIEALRAPRGAVSAFGLQPAGERFGWSEPRSGWTRTQSPAWPANRVRSVRRINARANLADFIGVLR